MTLASSARDGADTEIHEVLLYDLDMFEEVVYYSGPFDIQCREFDESMDILEKILGPDRRGQTFRGVNLDIHPDSIYCWSFSSARFPPMHFLVVNMVF